ncbi:glycosyltransferase [uncultured Desulfosarcina sp.]|uniref:glycosyltransferase n=1 Tax=uncultured Desulfosarcina sp. TaxID=218289 RepID=UPI0029C6B09E|nr:glycosyltransferase [uncultured Desulfosarcina sp.]
MKLNENIKFSVITPCFNSEKYIESAVISVLNQEGDFDIEYYIIDGGSEDRTISIVERYKRLIDSGRFRINCKNIQIKIISEKDNGMYDALVKGFKLITGNIVSYINSDDFYLPNAFKTLKRVFEKYPKISWLTGNATISNEDGIISNICTPYFYYNKFIRMGLYNGKILPFIQQESTFFKRELLKEIKYIELKKLKYAGDSYIWVCFARKEPLFIILALLASWRRHPNNLSSDLDKYRYEMQNFTEKININEEDKKILLYCQKRLKDPISTYGKNNNRIIWWEPKINNWMGNLSYEVNCNVLKGEVYC